MDQVELLVRRLESEDRILAERTSTQLIGNTFLFIGFVELAAVGRATAWLLLVVVTGGLAFTLISLRLNVLSERALREFKRSILDQAGGLAIGFPDPTDADPAWIRGLNVRTAQVWGVNLTLMVLWAACGVWVVEKWM